MGLLVSCLFQQCVPGFWIAGGVSPSWLVSWPLTSWWVVRNSFKWCSFVSLVYLEAGYPFPGNVEVWGGKEEEGSTWMLMKQEHQDPELTQTDQQLRILNGCSRSLLLICLLDLILMVLVKGGLCADREDQEGFSSPFSTGAAINARLMLIGADKISTPPECKGGRRLIPQNTIARKVLLSSWESIMFLSSSAWLLWSCIASDNQLWAHTVQREPFPSFSTAVVLLGVCCIVDVQLQI